VDQKYVRELRWTLRLYEGFQEGGQVSPLQVDQVRSTLLNAENAVLKDIQDMSNALDQFKLQLGVPVNMPLVLDDAPARGITSQLDRYYEILTESDAAYKAIERQSGIAPEKLRGVLGDLYANDPIVRGTTFRKKLPTVWGVWEKADDKQ